LKILVTGAGGFLGKAIVQRLLVHGQMDVRCMLRDTSKAKGLEEIAARFPGAKLEFVSVNLRNANEIPAAVADCEMVIHSAAALKGSPAEMFMDSVVASRNLLDAVAQRQPMRMVLVSSFGAMGVSGLGRGAMVDENTPMETHPERRDVYSYSKLRQE
jgi:nucleoside-diphosphate-sugar epimerase